MTPFYNEFYWHGLSYPCPFFVLFFHEDKFLQISQVVQISILKRLFLL
ncbi:hypothetical protein B4121_0301 [Bacillus paralicheniformis]|uniref:Uncharacterized protein n=1 Tax=Bacillus paralicheniformis TaxID=1648923 RepID=A0A7Z0X1W6_9BACI|nr:hypothetical protein B4121_0301 [Bacillus paralicheniformis]